MTLLRDSDSRMVFSNTAFAEVLTSLRPSLAAIKTDAYVLTDSRAPGFQSYLDFTMGAGDTEPPKHRSATKMLSIFVTAAAPPENPRGSSTLISCGPCTPPYLPPHGA